MVESHNLPSEEQLSRLRTELAELAADAHQRGRKCRFWALVWQVSDVALGLLTAMLAAVAGATGLISAAGRVPAAIMALVAAALVAATRFLRSNERYESNWRRLRAWNVLEREASFARASEGYPGTQSLYDTIRALLERRIAIMELDHAPIPLTALGRESTAHHDEAPRRPSSHPAAM
jgi:hypothetical protein